MKDPAAPISERLNLENVRKNISSICKDLFGIPISMSEQLSRQLPQEDINTLTSKTLDEYYVTHGFPEDMQTIEELANYVCKHGKTNEGIVRDLYDEETRVLDCCGLP